MPLSLGTKLGVYEVTAKIGAGGMGEVYRAHDTSLDRDVAIKVLPDAFANDPERLARFEREAKVLASLNHPNIAAIYGLEKSGETPALVLELVEGPTLAELIGQAPAARGTSEAEERAARGGGAPRAVKNAAIPLEEALPIARQIAEALEAAHEQGIIHRDLKPANVKVKADGTVKVLDFGLAKALQSDLSDLDAANSPTMTMTAAATKLGVIMGTAAYMSPEQAKGRQVDKRADIWAFGVVLYEMLTGRQAFGGTDISETLAAVLRQEMDWTELPADTPHSIRRLLRRCLERDHRRRLPEIGTARLEIDEADAPSEARAATAAPAPSSQPALWQRPAVVLAMVLGAIVVTGLAVWTSVRPSPGPPTRFAIPLPPDGRFPVNGRWIDWSADGRTLVFVAEADGGGMAYRRPLDQLVATPIPGTEGTNQIFQSPDGEWLGFSSGGTGLQKVSLTGGPPVTLCEECLVRGASWGADDRIVFAQGERGLWRIPAAGGEPEQLATAGPDEQYYRPYVLPDGRAVLFQIWRDSMDTSEVAVLSLESGETRTLVGGTTPRYAPTGHLLFGRTQSVWAAPFDPVRLELTGTPVPVLENVYVNAASGAAQYTFTSDGSLGYIPPEGVGSSLSSLVWVDRDGNEEALTAPPRRYVYPRVSPDGTRVALDVRDEENDIWIWDLARETLTRLTFAAAGDRDPVWTSDGQRVAFSSGRGQGTNIYWRAADGTGTVEALVEDTSFQWPFAASPDGRHLVFGERSIDSGIDLHVLTLDDERRVDPLIVTEFNERNGEISPDSRWLAYESDASGRPEVYVQPFPDVESGRWQVSTRGGTRPLRSPDGRELFYVSEAGLMQVAVETSAGFVPGTPALIVDGPYRLRPGGRNTGRTYDIAPDGQRFLMTKSGDGANVDAAPAEIVIVENWFEELKARVPIP